MIEELIRESEEGLPLIRSASLSTTQLGPDDVQAAVDYVRQHQDYTAYHLLFALLRGAPEAYERLDEGARARVLASSLQHLKFLNDWGYLDPHGSHDGEAAVALLELGDQAVGPLEPVLDDGRPAPLFGSEPATLSSMYGYRRKDFAHRYLLLILGEEPSFDPDPASRDDAISRLKASLRGPNGSRGQR